MQESRLLQAQIRLSQSSNVSTKVHMMTFILLSRQYATKTI
jgi:hypothetical protein